MAVGVGTLTHSDALGVVVPKVADTAVAEVDEVGNGIAGALTLIGNDARNPRAVSNAVEHDDILDLLRNRNNAVIHRGNDHLADAPGDHFADCLLGGDAVVSCVGEKDGPPEALAGGQNSVDHGDGVGRGQDTLADDPDRPGSTVAHTTGNGVTDVAELISGHTDPLSLALTHAPLELAGEHEGGRSLGDTSRGSDIGESRHRLPSPLLVGRPGIGTGHREIMTQNTLMSQPVNHIEPSRLID